MANINDEGFLELSGIHNTSYKESLNAEKFNILAGMTPLSLRVLNQACHRIHVAAGVEVMHAGDTPHDLYFIEKGRVNIGKVSGSEQHNVAQLNAGDFYGEYGALRGKTRFASVFTAEPSEIIRVDLTAVQQVFEADGEFRARLYAIMQERMLNSFLFGHPVFSNMPKATREVLARELDIVELERGETLFNEGDSAEKYYLILSGEAELILNINDEVTMIEVRRENAALGEVRVNSGKAYAHGIYGASSLDLLALDNEGMRNIKKTYPEALPLLNKFFSQSAKNTASILERAKKA